MGPQLITVRDHLAWSYANLARAHSALKAGRRRYAQVDHIVRSRLFAGLRNGKMAIGSIVADERAAKLNPPVCAYCGASGPLTLDHLIPRAAGGPDEAINLVAACRRCNSAKGASDLLTWSAKQNDFPPLLLLRRYLKVAAQHCEREGLLDLELGHPEVRTAPMPLDRLPFDFPPLDELRL